jgi:hypothetical protein
LHLNIILLLLRLHDVIILHFLFELLDVAISKENRLLLHLLLHNHLLLSNGLDLLLGHAEELAHVTQLFFTDEFRLLEIFFFLLKLSVHILVVFVICEYLLLGNLTKGLGGNDFGLGLALLGVHQWVLFWFTEEEKLILCWWLVHN